MLSIHKWIRYSRSMLGQVSFDISQVGLPLGGIFAAYFVLLRSLSWWFLEKGG